MSALGGDPNSIKQAAGQVASEAKVIGNALATATLLASAVAPPLSLGLAISAAIAHLWGSVQEKVANDPPREDWESFPGSPPQAMAIRRYGDPLDDWASAAAEQAHCIGTALLCAERLEGMRLSGAEPNPELAALQLSLGRYSLARAHRLWPMVDLPGSFHPVLQVLAQFDDVTEGPSSREARWHAADLVHLARERFDIDDAVMAAFHVTQEEWTRSIEQGLDAHVVRRQSVLAQAGPGLFASSNHADALFRWPAFDEQTQPRVRRFEI